MTLYVTSPMTRKEWKQLLAIGIAVFSGVIFLIVYFRVWLGFIPASLGIAGFTLHMKYDEREKC